MQNNTESRIGESAGGANNRSYKRYIVNLQGQICQSQQNSSVEIRDFCLGGMYVAYASTETALDKLVLAPAMGDVITIQFSLPIEPEEILQVQGRVVRSDLTSLGISFVQPNFLVLEKVLAYARAYQEQEVLATLSDHDGDVTAYSGLAYDVLLKNVRTITLKPIRALIDSYMEKQISVLMDMADKSVNITEQNAYFSTIEIFKKHGKQFRATFLKGMHQTVYSTPANIDQDLGTQVSELSSSGLSLVDDEAMDDWIARSEISDKAESAHLEALAGIEQRLSLLLGMKIWKQNNPIGPEAFSHAFQVALKDMDIDKSAYLVCCKIFRDVLREGLTELYQTINDYLIKNKILPELQYEIKVSEDAGTSPRRKSKNDIDSAREFLDTLDSDGGNNLYDLISSLQSNKHKNKTDGASDRRSFSTQQLIGKLSELAQQEPSDVAKDELTSRSLQLLEQLEQGDGEFQLGPREAAIMETTGSIYDALYKDDIITPGVKEWLSDVEMPLLQEAIKDESVLADKGHIARAFINQLSKLELYNDDSRDFISNSVKRTIEGLLKQIGEQPGMNEQLMSSLLNKINALVNIQDKAYNDNFSESLELCESEIALPTLKLKQLPDEFPVPMELQLREWRKRIRRIKVGDWILFNASSHESSRMKLAWISENFDQYVFVNMLGLMEGTIGVDDMARLLNSGAAMFLEDAEEPAVDRAQYSMLHTMHSQLMHETTHDQLTGLFNRREFEKQMKEELVETADVSRSNIICIFDVDYFEVVNSTYGYEAGDQLLVEIGDFIKEFFKGFGLYGRVGGNQFAVLLTDCSTQQAIDIVDMQKEQFSHYRFKFEESSTMVTLSAGVVAIDLERQEIPRLLQTAEAACRLAKSKGVNCMHVVEVDDDQIQENKVLMAWASKIDDSLTNDSLVLRYQPITPVSDSTLLSHSEILLGVTDESGSLVSPEPFILAAEKYRRMPEIDRWVVKNIFSFLNENPGVIDTIGGVAVNLSGLSVNDESFVPFILEQLEQLNVSTDYITFEITETAGIESLSSAAEFINEIKKTGCSFSLDDFGTGMSTYSYLKNLPVDYIKIDGSFVRDIENNDSDKAVVKSITEIGHFMGKKIIAECVEKESTIDLLRNLDVDYVQGYAISKPKLLKML